MLNEGSAWKSAGDDIAFTSSDPVTFQGVEPDGTNLQLVPNIEDGFDPDLD